LELLQNLQNGSTTVRGRPIIVTEVILAEVTGLLTKGMKWVEKNMTLQEVLELFADPGKELVRKGKVLHPASLSEPWQ